MTNPTDPDAIDLSVLIPVYNEVDNVGPLHDELAAVLAACPLKYELIFVDDGSTDGTTAKLATIQDDDPDHVIVASLKRNCGQTAALSAALDLARGSILVPMDGDRQNDPADIPRLLERLNQGHDVVSGWRRDRQDTLLTRKIPSRIANRLVAKISGVALHDFGCTMKAYRRSVLEGVRLYGEMHRFIPIFATWQGARVAEMVVHHRPRTAGKTKYGLGRTFNVVLDLILIRFFHRYAQRPIHLFGRVGLWSIFLSFLMFGLMLYFKFLHHFATGLENKDFVTTPLPLLTVILFGMGVQSILMGVLAEMVMRTYYESQAKTTYLLGEVRKPLKKQGRGGNHEVETKRVNSGRTVFEKSALRGGKTPSEKGDEMTKAIRITENGGPEVMRWVDVEVGEPGEGQARVRHTAVGVNYIDAYHRSGLYPLPLPTGLGLEAAGVVEAVGPGVDFIKPGDRVAYAGGGPGSYAETRLLPAGVLVPISDGFTDQVAAAVMLKGMTSQYLIRRTYRVKPGETVLFHAAAGGVGLIACQWLKALGATVIGTVGSDEKAAIAKAHGCDHVIISTREDIAARVREITRGAGVPVVYDSVGKDTFLASLDCLKPLGMMVSFGNASGKVAPFDIGILSQKGSLYLTRPTLATYTSTREDLEATAREVFDVIREGKVKVEIRSVYPLSEASRAHSDLEGRKTIGSIVMVP